MEGVPPHTYAEKWKQWLAATFPTVRKQIDKKQARYKSNFNARIRSQRDSLKKGSLVYVCKEHYGRSDPQHKLAPIADGPYEVAEVNDDTAVVLKVQERERISREGIVQLVPSTWVSQEVLVSRGQGSRNARQQEKDVASRAVSLKDAMRHAEVDNDLVPGNTVVSRPNTPSHSAALEEAGRIEKSAAITVDYVVKRIGSHRLVGR